MLSDHVAAEIGERLRRRGFLGGIEPGVDHHELGGDLRIDRLRGEGERVHAHDDFGILNEPTNPITPVFDIMPAIVPVTARP